ncbi:MAG: hypothetical protein RIQ53_3167 [Pseudomonadota bacterium]
MPSARRPPAASPAACTHMHMHTGTAPAGAGATGTAPSAWLPQPDRRAFGRALAMGAAGLALPPAAGAQPRTVADPWPALRQSLYGARPIADGADWLRLEAPTRAEDAAVVPVSVRALQPQQTGLWLRRLQLVIDDNPSPVGVDIGFTPHSGRADLETRVRVEQYTTLRAIAELSDGRLLMVTRPIKASGGCSAPAGKDPAEALVGLGRMRLHVGPDPDGGDGPALGQLMVRHPQISGLAIDPLTRLAPLPRYVREITLRLDDTPLLDARVDFTLSENPHLRFRLDARGARILHARVVDTEGARFEQQWPIGGA